MYLNLKKLNHSLIDDLPVTNCTDKSMDADYEKKREIEVLTLLEKKMEI